MTEELTFTAYQLKVGETAFYPEVGTGSQLALAYCGLGLGEAGEVQGKIKKVLRDDGGVFSPEKRDLILSECGDVLWYIARVCDELDSSLELVAQGNLDKTADRRARGVIGGSGDHR